MGKTMDEIRKNFDAVYAKFPELCRQLEVQAKAEAEAEIIKIKAEIMSDENVDGRIAEAIANEKEKLIAEAQEMLAPELAEQEKARIRLLRKIAYMIVEEVPEVLVPEEEDEDESTQ